MNPYEASERLLGRFHCTPVLTCGALDACCVDSDFAGYFDVLVQSQRIVDAGLNTTLPPN